MIPNNLLLQWKQHAPWQLMVQVEQDLVLSRAIVELYSNTYVAQKLVFRGGTALHKVHLPKALRYSEDLDFIHIDSGGIGQTLDAIRSVLDPWLGKPKREFSEALVKLFYRYQSADGQPSRLKIEINCQEQFLQSKSLAIPFKVNSDWFTGSAQVTTLTLDWLLGSKLRALYQRKKGRDLFDIYVILQQAMASPNDIVKSFLHHLDQASQRISRAEFESNLIKKASNSSFFSDIELLLGEGPSGFNFHAAHTLIMNELISKLPGEPWKGEVENDIETKNTKSKKAKLKS